MVECMCETIQNSGDKFHTLRLKTMFFLFSYQISLVAQKVKNLPAMQETQFHPWVGKIPWRRGWQPTRESAWTEVPGGLQSMRLQRVSHDRVTNTLTFLSVATDLALWYEEWSSSSLVIWCKQQTRWKSPWCWKIEGRGEEGVRRWDGWMASPRQWPWTWANSQRWWGAGKPGMLQSMGSQRARHDWAAEQQQGGMKVLVAQSYLTLCGLMDCSLPGSSVRGISQARILEWGAIPFSRGSSQPRDRTQVSYTAGRFFTIWANRDGVLEGLPCPPPGDFPSSVIELRSPVLQADSLQAEPPGKPKNTGVGSLSLLQGNCLTQSSEWVLLHCRRILYQLSYQEAWREQQKFYVPLLLLSTLLSCPSCPPPFFFSSIASSFFFRNTSFASIWRMQMGWGSCVKEKSLLDNSQKG